MRRAMVFEGTGGRGWMIQSKTVSVSGQMAVLEERVGTAMPLVRMAGP